MIQPGTKLAHYEIVSALGKGGMGEVLLREFLIRGIEAQSHQWMTKVLLVLQGREWTLL